MSYLYVYSPCCCSSNWQKNGKNKFLFYYSPSHIFQKKIKFLLFGRIFFLFSSFQEEHFCKQTPVLLVFFRFVSLSLWKLFRIFKMNLSDFFVFFFTQVFLNLFSSLLLDLLLLELCFFTFTFFIFLNNNLLCVSKNSSTYPFLNACVTSVCPFAHGFVHLLYLFLSSFFSRFLYICFPFPSFVFSVNNLSERQIEGTVANLKKNMFVYLLICWSLFSDLFVFAQSFVKNQIAYSMRHVMPFFSPLLSFFL